MHKGLSATLTIAALAVTPGLAPSEAAVYSTTASGYQFSLFIPDGVTTPLRGVFFHLTGAGGTTYFTSFTFAPQITILTSRKFAYMGTDATANGSFSYGSTVYAAIITALDSLAAKSGHAELRNAPVFAEGFSAGGMISFHFALHYPQRTIGFVQDKGGYADNTLRADAAAVPGMFVTGTAEPSSYAGNNPLIVSTHRSAYGALWSMWMEPGAGHQPIAVGHVWNFFQSIVDRRVPQSVTVGSPVQLMAIAESDGWLGSNDADRTIAAYACYTRAKARASWMPDQTVAGVWQSFCSSNSITTVELCSTAVGEPVTRLTSLSGHRTGPRGLLLTTSSSPRAPAGGTVYLMDGRQAQRRDAAGISVVRW
jgi:pimeloyl-ACP methyl ester carboxylesterase